MNFEITSSEGLPIRGNLDVPHGARALVVVIHGFKGFKDWAFFPWLSEMLCRHGFAVCRFNMSRSGIGESVDTFDRLDLFADDTYSAQIADVRKVAAFAQSHANLPTFLLGHSRGGGVAILAASHVANLNGVITWNAIARVDNWDRASVEQWRRDGYFDVQNARTKQTMRMSTRILDDFEENRERLRILAAVPRLNVPLLVIHGGRDETVPVAQSFEIAAAARDAAHVVIGSGSHTFNAIHPLVNIPPALSLAATVSARFVAAFE
jgi:pimeloyl-ACP methyl ester carboxylesterase